MQHQVIQKAIAAGTAKATRPFGRLCALSILAGAFIGLGGFLSVIIGYGFPEISAANPSMQRLFSALAFPIGLFMIVMFGADLFTGNNALLVTSVGEKKITWLDTIRNWTLVWIGNFVGCLLFVLLLVYLSGFTEIEPYKSAAANIATNKAALSPLTTFFRGIGANWCVCLGVWLALSADSIGGKALGCWIPVAAFVALGYEHCIANMFYFPYGLLAGADISIADAANNLLWATLGNIVGGALFVGHLFHRLYAK